MVQGPYPTMMTHHRPLHESNHTHQNLVMDDFFDSIQAASKSKVTLANYARREKKFLDWLKLDSPDTFDDVTGAVNGHQLTAAILCKFISSESLHVKTGKMKSFSTPEGYHSMFVSMFSRIKVDLPVTFDKEWAEFAKGYKNRIAEDISAGLLPTAGSDKITFTEYRILSSYAAKSLSFYAHGFLVLAWNLMTRSGSTADIKYQHLRMNGDYIVVVIPRH